MQLLITEIVQIKKFVRDYSRNVNESKFGESYAVVEEFNLNIKDYKTREVFFKYKEIYYTFTSSPKQFNIYLSDYTKIFSSLEFKNKLSALI